jgi:hypothetical protein
MISHIHAAFSFYEVTLQSSYLFRLDDACQFKQMRPTSVFVISFPAMLSELLFLVSLAELRDGSMILRNESIHYLLTCESKR